MMVDCRVCDQKVCTSCSSSFEVAFTQGTKSKVIRVCKVCTRVEDTPRLQVDPQDEKLSTFLSTGGLQLIHQKINPNTVMASDLHYVLDYDWGNPWPKAPSPMDDEERASWFDALNIEAVKRSSNLKRMCDLASAAGYCSFAWVNLITPTESIRVASHGMHDPPESCRRDEDPSAHALMYKTALIVPDTSKDCRFASHPIYTEDGIRFFSTFQLLNSSGLAIGTLNLANATLTNFTKSTQEALEKIAQYMMKDVQRIAMLGRFSMSDRFSMTLQAMEKQFHELDFLEVD